MNELPGSDFEGTLPKKAGRVSKILKYQIGKGEWQVLLISGLHAKKFACSRNFYCIFENRDGLKAYIWLNRFKPEQDCELTFTKS